MGLMYYAIVGGITWMTVRRGFCGNRPLFQC